MKKLCVVNLGVDLVTSDSFTKDWYIYRHSGQHVFDRLTIRLGELSGT